MVSTDPLSLAKILVILYSGFALLFIWLMIEITIMFHFKTESNEWKGIIQRIGLFFGATFVLYIYELFPLSIYWLMFVYGIIFSCFFYRSFILIQHVVKEYGKN
jgi:hypothetical protein